MFAFPVPLFKKKLVFASQKSKTLKCVDILAVSPKLPLRD